MIDFWVSGSILIHKEINNRIMKRIITLATLFIITSISAFAQDVYYCTYTLTSNSATYKCYVNGKLETVISSEEIHSNEISQSHIDELSESYVKSGWLTKSGDTYFYTDKIPSSIKDIIKNWDTHNYITSVDNGYINKRRSIKKPELKLTPEEVTVNIRRFVNAGYISESEDGYFVVIKGTDILHRFLSEYIKSGYLTESEGAYRVNNQSIN
mgnify:CR=1 FL=1